MSERTILFAVLGTILLSICIFAGVSVYNSTLRHEQALVRRTAPRPETAHERNVDRYLERFDRIVPGRERQ